VGSWPAPIGESLEFPRNGSTGSLDAKSSKWRSGLYKPLVADGQRRQDGDRRGKSMGSQIAREQIQQKIDSFITIGTIHGAQVTGVGHVAAYWVRDEPHGNERPVLLRRSL